MGKMLFTQKEVLNLLHKHGVAKFKASSFSEAVGRGQIPYHNEDGVRNKLYDYDEVANAIKRAGIGGVVIRGLRDVEPDDPKLIKNKKKKRLKDKLDDLPPPEKGQSKDEYGELVITELGSKPTITDANIYKTLYSGKLEKLKYEKEEGLLISREEVENKAFNVSRAIRDKILSIPERMSNELASITDAHTIKELLYKEFGMMLDGFSKDSFL